MASQFRVTTGLKGNKDAPVAVTLLSAKNEDEAVRTMRRKEMELWAAANEPSRKARAQDPNDPTPRVGREDLDEPYEVLSVEKT